MLRACLIALCSILILVSMATGADRTVLYEHFSATW